MKYLKISEAHPGAVQAGFFLLFFSMMTALLPQKPAMAQTGGFHDALPAQAVPPVKSDLPLLFSQGDALSDETIYSMEDAAAPEFSAWGGDDFVVPQVFESWQIEAVLVAGSPGNSPNLMDNITLRFYEAAEDTPGPATEPFASYENLSFTDQQDDNRFLYIELPEPLVLPSGNYWIAAAVHGNSAAEQTWFWRLNNSERYRQYHWVNPGGAFDAFYENWRPGSQVFPDFEEQDLVFQLFGFETLDTSIEPAPGLSEAGQMPAQLYQNYPNPFNPETTISYRLNETAPVRIEVYSLHGQRLHVIEQGVQPPGIYEVRFDAAGELASGVYLYRLQTNEHVLTRRMTLLK